MMYLRFWGVRGSTPTPQKENLRYGGNTSCLELRTRNGIFILDCGTGLRLLGRALAREFRTRRIQASIFLSHYHWDHIQGLPFFVPLYHEANSFNFYSFRSIDTSVQQALEDQMINPYFPVDMAAMRARREFQEIGEEQMKFDGLKITTRWLNHPQGCLGFRIESGKKTIVYATDNEPGEDRGDRNVRLLADGADVFIYDAQYTPEEYRSQKVNWGHSTWEEGVKIAREVGARKLILFHHDPDHNDARIDAILRDARKSFRSTVAAREGLLLRFS
jgi:phosphoribosyl 1,2-cyclic phosphodiesterase